MSQQQSTNPAETYNQYFVSAIFVPWTPILLDHAAPQPGEHVLDVACGTGVVAHAVAPLVGRDGTVSALDVSPAMLAVARNLPTPDGAAISWHEGNALALPFPNDVFDLVLCQQGLQFFPDRACAINEMHRVVRPTGRVVVSVWQALAHHPVYEALGEAIARQLAMPVAMGMSAFALGDADGLRDLFNQAGFQQVEIVPATQEVRFPQPERFVQLTVAAAAAVVPTFSQQNSEAGAALRATVSREVASMIQTYREDDYLAFPMYAHVAVAYR